MKCGRVKDKMRKDFRIGIIQTHPTQHHGPWWRKLNEQEGISVKVFYLTNQNQRGGDPDFKTKNPWDEDFVGGYEHEFLKTINGKITDKIERKLLHLSLIRKITRKEFDAFFVPTFYTWSYRLAAILCKIRKIPIIMQNDAAFISDSSYAIKRKFINLLTYPIIYSWPDYWITSGDHNEAYLRYYGVKDEKMIRGCIPVEGDRFRQAIARNKEEIRKIRDELCWDKNTILYGFVGKYKQRKNPLEFVEGIVNAHKKNPNIRGIMIGGGASEEKINSRLKSLNGEVLNIGFVNQSKIPLYFAAMDVFVITSSQDMHPLVVSEAMAADCPVIMSNRCSNWGYSDTLQHRYNGLVYSCYDLKSLTDSMLELAESEKREEYVKRVKETYPVNDVNFAVRSFMQAIEKIKQRKK